MNNPTLLAGVLGAGRGESRPPHDIKSPIEPAPILSPSDFVALALVIILAAAAFVLLQRVKAFFQQKTATEVSRDVVKDQEAWDSLKAMVKSIEVPKSVCVGETERVQAWSNFSSAVSLATRRAFEIRTGLPLAEQTTEEILIELHGDKGSVVLLSYPGLESFLRRLDDIRFAGVLCDQREGVELLEELKKIIAQLEISRIDAATRSDRGLGGESVL